MARSVTFNGITRYRPGAITKINAEALNQIGINPSGTIGLIGESDGGAPGSEGLVSLRDASRASTLFRSGPLVDAIKLAFQSSGDPLVPGGASEVLVYKTNASVAAGFSLPSPNVSVVSTTVRAGSTTTVINVNATLVASEHIGRWVEIGVAALPGSPTYLRRITANAGGAGTSSLTITPAVPSAPAAADTCEIRVNLLDIEASDYGLHTTGIQMTVDYDSTSEGYQVSSTFEGDEQLSPVLGGTSRNYLHVVYRGGAVADTSVVTASSTTSVINVTPASLINVAHVNQTFILTDSAGNLKAISKITTNTTGSITLTTALSAVPEVGDLVTIRSVTAALGQFNGASGVTTAFATTITGVTGDDLAITISAAMTLRELAAAINANPNYLATVPSVINQDTTLASEFDFGSGTSTSMQTSYSGTVATSGFRQNLNEVLDWINSSSAWLTASRSTTGALDGGKLALVDYPDTTGDALPWMFQLYGGARGISANSDFQDGLDAMLLEIVDEVVPLIHEDLTNEGNSSTATVAAVAAQLADHVIAARGATGKERGAWIGLDGTKAEVIALANTINDPDIALTCQNPTVVDVNGNLVEKGPRELAVMGASMRCGVNEVGEPLTNKYLRVSALSQDSGWHPSDATDSTDMILNGVMFAETVAGQGTRWVRDLTTWVRDDNLAYSEGSVRDVVRYVAYGLRVLIERRFTGRKATPATIASIKDAVSSLLEVYRTGNIIVDSTDPATGSTVRAYYGLKVTSSGDVVTVTVGFFPVPGINFELIDLAVSLATQSA